VDQFIVNTDASNVGDWCSTSQVQDGGEWVVAYLSITLSKAERYHCVILREWLAMMKTSEELHKYFKGQNSHLHTDTSALTN
jgi:endo-alpha-1,4-polygalactosaminidase (GH114 family)